jgi:hypothetical protein
MGWLMVIDLRFVNKNIGEQRKIKEEDLLLI